MKTTNYLDKPKEKQGLKSDYQLAKILNLESSNITMYRNGKRVMDDYTAAKLAEILKINPHTHHRAGQRRVREERREARLLAILYRTRANRLPDNNNYRYTVHNSINQYCRSCCKPCLHTAGVTASSPVSHAAVPPAI